MEILGWPAVRSGRKYEAVAQQFSRYGGNVLHPTRADEKSRRRTCPCNDSTITSEHAIVAEPITTMGRGPARTRWANGLSDELVARTAGSCVGAGSPDETVSHAHEEIEKAFHRIDRLGIAQAPRRALTAVPCAIPAEKPLDATRT